MADAQCVCGTLRASTSHPARGTGIMTQIVVLKASTCSRESTSRASNSSGRWTGCRDGERYCTLEDWPTTHLAGVELVEEGGQDAEAFLRLVVAVEPDARVAGVVVPRVEVLRGVCSAVLSRVETQSRQCCLSRCRHAVGTMRCDACATAGAISRRSGLSKWQHVHQVA